MSIPRAKFKKSHRDKLSSWKWPRITLFMYLCLLTDSLCSLTIYFDHFSPAAGDPALRCGCAPPLLLVSDLCRRDRFTRHDAQIYAGQSVARGNRTF
jgi:hypothetical protein